MPVVRRRCRVYFDYSYSRKMRMEAWLSFSIYVAAGIFLFSLLLCLPAIISMIVSWVLPPQDSYSYQGAAKGADSSSLLMGICGILMAFSGAYLIPALFIRFHTRH